MDLDAFSAVHGGTWARLDELAKRRRLTGAESDELVRLYQEVATHLSTVRSVAPDPAVVSRLSDILGRARNAISGSTTLSWRSGARFLTVVLPAALYRTRWWSVGVTAASLVLGTVAGLYAYTHPAVLDRLGTPAERREYAQQAFANYYSEHPHASFAAQVWTNNALIAAMCIVLGITGVGVLWVLLQNVVNVGVSGAMMAEQGAGDVFFQLILPHGQLELMCVFVAAGAGLKLFWTVVAPGGRPRGRAVADEGLALFTVALSLGIGLLVSGLIEGFVTPSGLPWGVKIAIGTVALAAFWAYTIVLGRRAAHDGEFGGLLRGEGADELPIAA